MISVIIPTYNRSKTLARSVDSVLNQDSIDEMEVIIVDDGSTDDTEALICNKYRHETRVRYYKQKNQGACSARNYGIDQARGEDIAFQDSDDVWRKNKLSEELNALKENNADVVFCALNANGDKYPKDQQSGFVKQQYFFRTPNSISTQTILGKKSVFRDIRFDPQMPRLQDRDIAIRLAGKYKVYYLDRILVDVYTQEDSISKNNKKGIIAIQRILSKYEKELTDDITSKNKLLSDLCWYYLTENINCNSILLEIYNNEKTPKNFVKLTMGRLHLLHIYYGWKKNS